MATIQTMGLAGDTFLDIGKGTRRAPEATLPSTEPFDLNALMQQGSAVLKSAQTSIINLQTSGDRTLQSINSAARHSDRTIVAVSPDVEAIVASTRKTTQAISELVAQVSRVREQSANFSRTSSSPTQ